MIAELTDHADSSRTGSEGLGPAYTQYTWLAKCPGQVQCRPPTHDLFVFRVTEPEPQVNKRRVPSLPSVRQVCNQCDLGACLAHCSALSMSYYLLLLDEHNLFLSVTTDYS